MTEKSKFNVLDLFEENKLVKVCAPMVRYSKLQFRNLVRLYNCDLTFTPMIIANSFCQSEKARKNEFTTNLFDTPLITQFAANSVNDFVGAAYMVSPYCNGVDLNCGCPQRWAKELELGCAMLKSPEIIYDIIRQCRNRITKPFTVSVKLRLLNQIDETVNLCKQLELCGVSFLSVHARTSNQLTGDINKTALKLIKENCNIPIIANGGLSSLDECISLQSDTHCDGFMIANALLTNPMLFSGLTTITENCIQTWLNICYNSTLTEEMYERKCKNLNSKCIIGEKPYNLSFQCFHHHLVFMLEKLLSKKDRQIFNSLKTFTSVLDFIEHCFNIKPQLFDSLSFYKYFASNLKFSDRAEVYTNLTPLDSRKSETNMTYDLVESSGKYFNNKVNYLENTTECDWSDIFAENC